MVRELLDAASRMGFGYVNATEGIGRLTAQGVEFRDGCGLEAEISIVFPNWKPHDFLRGLPISDEVGFVITDMKMRNPDHPEIFACGDAAAITVSKLGAIGHQETEVVGRQIAREVGGLPAEKADEPWMPEVICIGDMGGGKAFYIHSNEWFGGDMQVLKMGRLLYAQKVRYKEMFFRNHGKIPNWGAPLAQWAAEHIEI